MAKVLLENDKLPPYRGQSFVRVSGTILLTAAFLMLMIGLTLLDEWLRGPRFVLYWSWCFLVTMVAMVIALFDMLLIRRTSKQTRRALFRQQFMAKDLAEKRQRKQDN